MGDFVIGNFGVVFVGGVYEMLYYIFLVIIVVSVMVFYCVYVDFGDSLLGVIMVVVLGEGSLVKYKVNGRKVYI